LLLSFNASGLLSGVLISLSHSFSSIGLFLFAGLIIVLESVSLFYISFVLLVLLTLLWSLLNASTITDVKSIIAYSTISQISYMFIALIVCPLFTLFHILLNRLVNSYILAA